METAVPVAETYNDVEKLIYHICYLFQRRNGGDFEELVSEANLTYMKVYESWEPDKGSKFSTYLATCIYRRLLDVASYEWRRNCIRTGVTSESSDAHHSTCFAVPIDGIDLKDDYQEFNEDSLFEGFSSDARLVINLVLDAPKDLLDTVRSKGGEIRNWRSTIKEFLSDMGWTAKQITESFNEVRSVL